MRLKRTLLGVWLVFVFVLFFRLWHVYFDVILRYVRNPELLGRYVEKFFL